MPTNRLANIAGLYCVNKAVIINVGRSAAATRNDSSPRQEVHWLEGFLPRIPDRANRPGTHVRGTIQEFLISVRPTFEIHFEAVARGGLPRGNADNEFGSHSPRYCRFQRLSLSLSHELSLRDIFPLARGGIFFLEEGDRYELSLPSGHQVRSFALAMLRSTLIDEITRARPYLIRVHRVRFTSGKIAGRSRSTVGPLDLSFSSFGK